MKEIDMKKEFTTFCWGISKINDEWTFWWELLGEKEDKYIIYKNKMKKLLSLLNENEKSLLEKDIENEIWDLI